MGACYYYEDSILVAPCYPHQLPCPFPWCTPLVLRLYFWSLLNFAYFCCFSIYCLCCFFCLFYKVKLSAN
ncbi:hypothetical protein M405DRAFT_34035 [Rhizopogon salebrosus TDB-379]|nr:hypothetical protein M405DRAFT_34035 [Rhizopogon salebrosus TDB-379]